MKITKLYSDYDEYYDEKLYSTGNEDLDELLERAFCEGYEYAQREFAYVKPEQINNWFKSGGKSRALKKAQNAAGHKAMAEQMLSKGKEATPWQRETILGSPSNTRRLTSRSTMWNGTYANDLNIPGGNNNIDLKITRRGSSSAGGSWSGVHGTTLGNMKRK